MREDPDARCAGRRERTVPRWTIVVLAVLCAFAAAACSSGSVVDSTDTTAAPRSTEAATFAPGTSTGTAAPRMVVAPVDKPFCDRAEQAANELSEMTDSDPQALPRFQQYLGELTALAPGEIKDSVSVLNKIARSAPSIKELSKIKTPELDAANHKVEAWSKAHCGTTN
jgi:hypothetical protein